MRRVLPLALALALIALVYWLWPRHPAATTAAPAAKTPPASSGGEAPSASAGDGAVAARSKTPAERREARARRDALRDEIVKALDRRAAAAPAPAPAPAEAVARPPGDLRDRTGGGHDAMLRALNEQFMPLADECIEQALQRRPELAGMVALSLETVAEEGLGAVVDVAAAAPRNEVADAELLECLAESAQSLSLPPTAATGREKLEITLRVGEGR